MAGRHGNGYSQTVNLSPELYGCGKHKLHATRADSHVSTCHAGRTRSGAHVDRSACGKPTAGTPPCGAVGSGSFDGLSGSI